ncbi:cilia- and flagella-associated protein 206-like [Anopheles albimanus]|uniref:Cilia- and flagella-associated protein 206 n=1 Tax=Anopheles albimanus TaxID=7167 RepID=A0A182F5Q7_ANOAL|nr:cilia- and flagella-associated protein 206-like [Anopheles albimanus]
MSAFVAAPSLHLLEPNVALMPLLQDIFRNCERRNIRYDRPLVHFVTNLLSLDPRFELFMETVSVERRNHDDFVEACCALLAEDRAPGLITIKMQVYFLGNFFDKDEIIEKHARNLQAKTFALTKEIIDHDVITKDEQDEIFNKVILDIVMNMGLGNPECKDVIAETMRALNSVMSRSDKAKFVTLDRKDRLIALKDIREIVAGIRIFNKHSGNTANGMADLPKILDQSHESTKSILQITLCEIMDKVNLLTSALNAAIAYDLRNRAIITLLPENITPEDFETIKDLLIMYRQHEVYTRKLIDELATIKTNIDSCKQEYEAKLLRIHEAVQFRTAIPTDRVFPKFSELTRVWLQFQNFIFLLSEMNQINNMLMNLTERCISFDDLAYRLLGESQIQTDVDRLNKMKNKRLALPDSPNHCEVVPYEENMPIQLLKFCLWHVAEGRGLLMPGSVEMGVCRVHKENYLFNIPEPVEFFDEDPHKYFYKIVEMARRKIHIISLLNLYSKVRAAYNAPRSEGFQLKITTTCEQEVQTDLHPIPSCIDREYRWNVWDYRREAIRLADLRNKRTTSVQTLESCRSIPKATQIYTRKVQSTQTRISRGTETEQRSRSTGMKVLEPSIPSPLKVYALTLAQANHSAFGRNGERSN